jgi:hypothetical protein
MVTTFIAPRKSEYAVLSLIQIAGCACRPEAAVQFQSEFTARRSRNQKQTLCTTESRRPGEQQKINGCSSARRTLAVPSRAEYRYFEIVPVSEK